MEARLSQRRQQMPPGMGRIREAVEAEGERTRPGLEDREVDAVRAELARDSSGAATGRA
jgi:hypothetical protein